MSIQAYQKTATKTESPRQTEYRAFAAVTQGLIEASQMPATELGRKAEALARNRRLWSLLAADCAADGNLLPNALRAQIISLSLFVDRHSRSVLRGELQRADRHQPHDHAGPVEPRRGGCGGAGALSDHRVRVAQVSPAD
jgi:flagellar biosynthesis activator protein FlaF